VLEFTDASRAGQGYLIGLRGQGSSDRPASPSIEKPSADALARSRLSFSIISSMMMRFAAATGQGAVGLVITAAHGFTSSFATPAVLARGFTTTFAGIAIYQFPAFFASQISKTPMTCGSSRLPSPSSEGYLAITGLLYRDDVAVIGRLLASGLEGLAPDIGHGDPNDDLRPALAGPVMPARHHSVSRSRRSGSLRQFAWPGRQDRGKWKGLAMAWFGVGSGSRRAKPQRAQRFVQADRVVMEVFADLHETRHLRSKFPAMSRGALQVFERKAWNRLIDYLIKLPPLPSDD